MAAIDCRWARTVCWTARSCAADMAPGGLGSAGRCSFDGTVPAIDRARSENPRNWETNSSIDRANQASGRRRRFWLLLLAAHGPTVLPGQGDGDRRPV